jgi:UDP-glucose 4-epimerase
VNILVTGAAGYIGSHTLVALLEAGHQPVAVDNYCNSKPVALARVAEITGRGFPHYQADVRDRAALGDIFKKQQIEAVIHCAGLKSVGESTHNPWAYYSTNLVSTLTLIETMAAQGCFRLVFTSSATVYGEPKELPLREDAPLSASSPYGRTKLFIEEMLRDITCADARWKMALLRCSNPVGAHPSGQIGEDPNGFPNNLFPYIAQVAVGRRPEIEVYGGDYPTPDGTGVRDYIHVSDLAAAHRQAVECLEALVGAEAINLGTGRGYSVLEAIHAFEQASGRRLAYKMGARRPGDVPACYLDPGKAARLLQWRASKGLDEMCADQWRWQSRHPQGYGS